VCDDGRCGRARCTAGTYSFRRYKRAQAQAQDARPPPQLLCPLQAEEHSQARAQALDLAQAVFWCRDLINTPANDLGPAELAAEACAMAEQHGAQVGGGAGGRAKRRWRHLVIANCAAGCKRGPALACPQPTTPLPPARHVPARCRWS
jgi:leucyl aminopeptidase